MDLIFTNITFIFGVVSYMVANLTVLATPILLYILTRRLYCIMLGMPISIGILYLISSYLSNNTGFPVNTAANYGIKGFAMVIVLAFILDKVHALKKGKKHN